MHHSSRQPARFRFAPSPNGRLHLGHAYSAFLNHDMARTAAGEYLVRIENIDATRCTPELEASMLADLAWLGLSSDQPERRQSEHLPEYAAALSKLEKLDLTYPAFLTRGEVRGIVRRAEEGGAPWPRDPDGAPLYPDMDRLLSLEDRQARLANGERHAIRLDMRKALALAGRNLRWTETGRGREERVEADPSRWGDIVLSRSDAPGSYALCVVVDDAAQGITHVVRGADLYEATSVQRLLQVILGLPEPVYHHHRLVLGADGQKLSKSNRSPSLAALREQAGATPSDIRRLVGLEDRSSSDAPEHPVHDPILQHGGIDLGADDENHRRHVKKDKRDHQ